MWQAGENGKIKSLVSGLGKASHIRGLQKEDEEIPQLNKLVETFEDTKGNHTFWACKYLYSKVSSHNKIRGY